MSEKFNLNPELISNAMLILGPQLNNDVLDAVIPLSDSLRNEPSDSQLTERRVEAAMAFQNAYNKYVEVIEAAKAEFSALDEIREALDRLNLGEVSTVTTEAGGPAIKRDVF